MAAKYAVLGAGGGTGKACVENLLQQGCHVRAVVRDPEKAKEHFPWLCNVTLADLTLRERLELVQGDVTDTESLRGALAGCSGIIFAASGKGYWSAGAVDRQAVANVAQVAKEQGGVERIVLISSALVTPARRLHPIRILLNNIRWGLMDAKFEGEQLLRRSGVAYTVVRPGGLTNDPPGQAQLVAGQGDSSSGRVARSDVAAVCWAALTDPVAKNVTLELTNKPFGEGAAVPLAEQLKEIFQGLQPDSVSAQPQQASQKPVHLPR